MLFGPYHIGGNHWTLVYIDISKKQLVYIDPLGPPNEHELAETFAYHWLEWALLHNSSCPESVVPTDLEAVTVEHAVQMDSRNCGIFTMCVHNNLQPLPPHCLCIGVCFVKTSVIPFHFSNCSLLRDYFKEVELAAS